jgi:hypothetical protein
MGGRFNPKLTFEDGKRAGWIFSKSKENEVRNLLNTDYQMHLFCFCQKKCV